MTFLQKGVTVAKMEYFDVEGDGRRLVIHQARLNHSGLYECTASNRYQTVVGVVTLVVWPIGTLTTPLA